MENVIKIKEIYFYTFWLTLADTRRKSSLKTKFLNRLTKQLSDTSSCNYTLNGLILVKLGKNC